MRKFTSVLSCGLLALATSPAIAAFPVDATFSAGASLSDFGFAGAGPPDPNTNVAGGVWNNALAAGQLSYWSQPSMVTQFTGTVVHGFADIAANPISTIPDDLTVFRFSTAGAGGYLGRLAVTPGIMEMLTFPGGAPLFQSVAVANGDGFEHRYGWELNRTTGNVKLFFDGLQVGNGGGYAAGDNQADPSNSFYMGDGTGGGTHTDVWNRVVIATGAYPVVPEPSTILLATGLLGVVASVRRKRRW